MSIPDELVEKVARALYDHDREVRGGALGPYPAWDRALDDDHEGYRIQADLALGAVGLPALLERVEAADSRPADLAHDCAENEHDCAGKAEYGACDEGPDETVVCACSCHLADRDALAAKVADAGERIALAIEKADRKVIDKRVEGINAKPHIVDRSLTYAAQIARTALTEGTQGT